MSTGNDRDLEELAATANSLVDTAIAHEDLSEKLLRKLETALNALDSARTELIRDMPNEIAQGAAKKVVESIAELVTQKVADVLRPAEKETQRLLGEIKEAAATYRSAARDYRRKCIIAACIWGSLSAALVAPVAVFAMKMAAILHP